MLFLSEKLLERCQSSFKCQQVIKNSEQEQLNYKKIMFERILQ